MEFVHLHIHTHYSLLDAVSKIPDLVERAEKYGMKALAITDYDSMYGVIEFYKQCKAKNIKPILGFEANVEGRHLVLLAENTLGYKNLLKLSSFGHLNLSSGGSKPRIEKEILKRHSKGAIALSGCISGEIQDMIKRGEAWEKIVSKAMEFKKIFGTNEKNEPCFFLELQDHPERSGQFEINESLIKLSGLTGIPIVVTRDVHYLDREDAYAQDIMACIKEGRTVNEPGRPHLRDVDLSFSSGEETAKRFAHAPSAVENTLKIASRCNVELKLNVWHFPKINLPEDISAEDYLKNKVYEGLKNLNYNVTEEVKKRIDLELSVINGKGYAPYFLAVADYINYARKNNIVETTRGSAAGSLVSYALGITTVDPLYFKLPFERFLNPYRPSAPDIDTDFADDKRDEMIKYVTEKYGEDKVAQIITFGTMMARAAVRDAGRALGLAYHFCDQVAKLIPFGKQGFQMTIKEAMRIEPDLKKLYDSNLDAHKLIDLAKKIEGCARHTSIHAAGVVISPEPLTEFTPVQYEVGGTRLTTQYDMDSVEAAGLLKMDFLGIRNLSILGKAVEIVEKTAGEKIDIYNLPFDDKKTFKMLARGETAGVFQLSGSGMTRYLKELKPTSIFDIMAMVALFRPGPMESIPEFIRRKHNPEMIEYLDPRLKNILDKSYGIMVYQDDVLLTSIELAGYTWEEADKFRKAMGKKIPEEMAKQKDKFLKGCKEYGGLSELKSQRLWQLIEPFAAYGFNKAHASSYAVVAYQTAYMKANFPVQYMTAVLTAESNDLDKISSIVRECERMGIRVLAPDVNESFRDFAIIPAQENEPPKIRFGLKAIKNIGEHIVSVIYENRKNGGKFASLEDFLERIKDKDLNKKSLEALAKSGAMDCFCIDRNVLVESVENLIAYNKAAGVSTAGQDNLFSGIKFENKSRVRLKDAQAATDEMKLNWERELLGLFISSHPFMPYAKVFEGIFTAISEIHGESGGAWVVFGGIISYLKKKITKTGKIMMFADIEDVSGRAELLVFPKVYESAREIWKEGGIIWCVGKTSEEEGDNKIFVDKAGVLTMDNIEAVKGRLSFSPSSRIAGKKMSEKRIIIKIDGETKAYPSELKNLFKQYPGEYQIVFNLNGSGKKLLTPYFVSSNKELFKSIEKIVGQEALEVID